MAVGEWKDVTSYSRGERGKAEPRAWRLENCSFEITVHRLHGISDEWFYSCPALLISPRVLPSNNNLDAAKNLALDGVRARLTQLSESLHAAVFERRRTPHPPTKEDP